MKPSGGSQDDISAPGTKAGMPYIGTIRIGPASATSQMQPIGLNQITAIPPRQLPTAGGGAQQQQQQQNAASNTIVPGMGNPPLGSQAQANLMQQLSFPGVGVRTPAGTMTSIAPGMGSNFLQQSLQPLLQQRPLTTQGLNLAAVSVAGYHSQII